MTYSKILQIDAYLVELGKDTFTSKLISIFEKLIFFNKRKSKRLLFF